MGAYGPMDSIDIEMSDAASASSREAGDGPRRIPTSLGHDTKTSSGTGRFRVRTRYMIVTWAGVNPHHDEIEFDVYEPQRLAERLGGKCTLAREKHKTSTNIHYHAFFEHPQRFNLTKNRSLDVGGYHPNIRPIHSTPWLAKKYVMKDNDIIYDDTDDPPMVKRRKKPDSHKVWQSILNQTSYDEVLRLCREEQPRSFACNFGNIERAARYLCPEDITSAYTSPEGLELETNEYPEIDSWRRTYLGCGDDDRAVVADREPTPCSLPSLSFGEGSSVGGFSLPDIGDIPQELAEYLDCSELQVQADTERYSPPLAPHVKPANRPQARPKCLILWGPTKLGKTLLARSFGHHTYFNDLFNLDAYDETSKYAVFDDIGRGLRGFNYKGWLGGQHEFTSTDKYKKKQRIVWNKPSIYVCNRNPFETDRNPYVDLDWLRENSICVHVTSPICNLARLDHK